MILCARIFKVFHRSISIENQQLGIIKAVFFCKQDGIGRLFIEIIEKLEYIRAYRHTYITENASNALILAGKDFFYIKLLVF